MQKVNLLCPWTHTSSTRPGWSPTIGCLGLIAPPTSVHSASPTFNYLAPTGSDREDGAVQVLSRKQCDQFVEEAVLAGDAFDRAIAEAGCAVVRKAGARHKAGLTVPWPYDNLIHLQASYSRCPRGAAEPRMSEPSEGHQVGVWLRRARRDQSSETVIGASSR